MGEAERARGGVGARSRPRSFKYGQPVRTVFHNQARGFRDRARLEPPDCGSPWRIVDLAEFRAWPRMRGKVIPARLIFFEPNPPDIRSSNRLRKIPKERLASRRNAMADNILIHLTGVNKVFTTDEVETHALAGIELDIRRGEYISISGPSGCGKSTLLAILGLLDTPSTGEYTLNDIPVAKMKLSERARVRNREIGFIFQAFNLIGDLTVYENVELLLTYRSMPSAERKIRVKESLERVGMAHRMKHY